MFTVTKTNITTNGRKHLGAVVESDTIHIKFGMSKTYCQGLEDTA